MIGNDWDIVLENVWNSEGFKKFYSIVKNKYRETTCYPAFENIFYALKCTPFNDVKVVIIGQDPYHEPNQAHGLSFSVKDGVALPPSLKNIYKELNDDLSVPISNSGDLTKWAKQGVLLLNSILSVEKGKALSHKDLGWTLLTDYIIQVINSKKDNVVFILWGNYAKSKKKFITNKSHLVIESAHPSPFSAYSGFFGSRPFSKTNKFLIDKKKEPINF